MRHAAARALLLLAVFATALAGCDARNEANGSEGKLSIVATTGMIADVARTIAGDRASVTSLMGEGVDPHLYKPTRADMAALSRASVVFYNGLLLEGKMTDTLERLANAGRPVHAVAAGLSSDELLEPEDHPGHPDPHVWMDPLLWIRTAETVRDQLAKIDPAGAEAYRASAAAYIEQLKALHEYSLQALSTVPEPARALVTAHDAFNYFGRRYGYEVVGIQGISTESEAGVRDIERLVDLLVTRKIPAVFVESTVSDRNINALIAGARARGHTVRIGGELFSDAMGAPGTYEGTYIGMIDHNITTMVRALGGEAPERGFKGRLTSPGEGKR
jgi:manganese/zinc/iron transport system substrate-binding protein